MTLIKKYTAAFVGNGIEEIKNTHPQDNNLLNVISTELFLIVKELYKAEGITTFICNREQGFNKIAADAVTKFQRFYPNIQLVYIESGEEEYILANSSALIALFDEPDELCKKAFDKDISIYNMYEDFSDYLAGNSEAKTFFQQYSQIESIHFCKEGIFVRGVDEEPWIIPFEEMETFMMKGDAIELSIQSGIKLQIPLHSKDCKVMFP